MGCIRTRLLIPPNFTRSEVQKETGDEVWVKSGHSVYFPFPKPPQPRSTQNYTWEVILLIRVNHLYSPRQWEIHHLPRLLWTRASEKGTHQAKSRWLQKRRLWQTPAPPTVPKLRCLFPLRAEQMLSKKESSGKGFPSPVKCGQALGLREHVCSDLFLIK